MPNILPSLSDSQINLSQILALILLLGLCLVLLSSTTFYIVKKFRKSALQNNNKPTFDPEASIDYDIVNRLKMINNPNEPNEISITSGTGSGMPLFIKRTFCRDIVLKESIYKGKKIEVWRGLWLDRNIAVKIFSSRDEDIWTRERDMYIKVSNMSPFILSLLGADLTSNNSCTEYWLITEYCQIGSLYDFLNVQTLTYAQCYSLLRSIISGIKTLHYEFPSYSIAHRDLKSKNILLHTPWQACIADFGLAVSTEDSGDMYCEPQKFKVGTKRYMAPEILDETFDYRYFESFQLVDMYCFSLVMWEILTRCKLDGNTTVEEYCLPYGKVVPSDPSFGDMKKVVCEDNQRPFISEALKNDKVSIFLIYEKIKSYSMFITDDFTIFGCHDRLLATKSY